MPKPFVLTNLYGKILFLDQITIAIRRIISKIHVTSDKIKAFPFVIVIVRLLLIQSLIRRYIIVIS